MGEDLRHTVCLARHTSENELSLRFSVFLCLWKTLQARRIKASEARYQSLYVIQQLTWDSDIFPILWKKVISSQSLRKRQSSIPTTTFMGTSSVTLVSCKTQQLWWISNHSLNQSFSLHFRTSTPERYRIRNMFFALIHIGQKR